MSQGIMTFYCGVAGICLFFAIQTTMLIAYKTPDPKNEWLD